MFGDFCCCEQKTAYGMRISDWSSDVCSSDLSGPMEDVIGWRIDDVVEKIKGPKRTQVRLDVIPAAMGLDAEPTRILLTRAKIRLAERAAKSEILTLPDRKSTRLNSSH